MQLLSSSTLGLFVLTLIGVLAGLFWGVYRYLPKKFLSVSAGIVAWTAVIGIPAFFGFFERFDTFPPRILLILAPMVLFLIFLSVSPTGRVPAQHFPLTFLIGFQVFRIPVEIFLYRAYTEGQLPIEMTFAGRNYEIFIGSSAPLVAMLTHYYPHRFGSLLLFWNVLGMVILSVVVFHGLGAAPTPIQFLHLNPDNRVIGYFPYVYLPSILVFTAFTLHILAIRKIRGSSF